MRFAQAVVYDEIPIITGYIVKEAKSGGYFNKQIEQKIEGKPLSMFENRTNTKEGKYYNINAFTVNPLGRNININVEMYANSLGKLGHRDNKKVELKFGIRSKDKRYNILRLLWIGVGAFFICPNSIGVIVPTLLAILAIVAPSLSF